MDLISRQEAIDAILEVTGNSSVRELYEYVQEHELSDMWSGGIDAALDIIIAVPSAQPDYKTDHGYMWLCPECGLAVHSDYTSCVRCGWERRTDE